MKHACKNKKCVKKFDAEISKRPFGTPRCRPEDNIKKK